MTKQDLYNEAGILNNRLRTPIDIVTIMAFMDIEECRAHVERYRKVVEDQNK